jgi:hypothetical protein
LDAVPSHSSNYLQTDSTVFDVIADKVIEPGARRGIVFRIRHSSFMLDEGLEDHWPVYQKLGCKVVPIFIQVRE